MQKLAQWYYTCVFCDGRFAMNFAKSTATIFLQSSACAADGIPFLLHACKLSQYNETFKVLASCYDVETLIVYFIQDFLVCINSFIQMTYKY